MRNGLYSIHVHLLDGRNGKGSGVVVFRDGRIVGGDAYLYYDGSYTTTDNSFKGEVQVMQHTPSADQSPLFGNQFAGRHRCVGHLHRDQRDDERHSAGRQGKPDLPRHAATSYRRRLSDFVIPPPAPEAPAAATSSRSAFPRRARTIA